MNWYIGQEIVCIDATEQIGYLKEGAVYKVRGVSACRCETNLDIGQSDGSGSHCYDCNTDVSDDVLWFKSRRFAPLEYNQDAINELLEQTKVEYAKL